MVFHRQLLGVGEWQRENLREQIPLLAGRVRKNRIPRVFFA